LEPARVPYRGSDDALLDEMERAALDFFRNETGATTGQVKDRALLKGNDTLVISSIAATGFALSGLSIAEARFAMTSPPSGCQRDFHPRAVEHARHTKISAPLAGRAWLRWN